MAVSRVLSAKDLNRALLARQMLLERSDADVLTAVESLAGMQSQSPLTMYTGLWSRLKSFQPQELSRLLTDRSVVRMALMRSTVHLVAAADAVRWRILLSLCWIALCRASLESNWQRSTGTGWSDRPSPSWRTSR